MHDSTAHALPRRRAGHSHEASTTKEAEGGTEEGASDRTGNSITVNIVWQKKKKKVKKKTPKGTQAALGFAGAGSELAGAAGVALQEAHDGRVALGPSDELLQGEFSWKEEHGAG